ncbi:MAG: NUDIX domain-containing protein [Nocardioides sp.]
MGYVEELRAAVGNRTLLLAAAGVIVLDERGRILLQRRADDGLWGIPGGALEPGESFEDAARRELEEETGLESGHLRLVDTYSGPDFFVRYPDGDQAFVVGATFTTDQVTGEACADGVEGSEVAWFERDALPPVNDYNSRLLRRAGVLDA